MRVVFRLAGNRVAVAKQELLAGVMLEMLVAAHVDHGGALSLRCGMAPSLGRPIASNRRPKAIPKADF
jgi:hypothetical protein